MNIYVRTCSYRIVTFSPHITNIVYLTHYWFMTNIGMFSHITEAHSKKQMYYIHCMNHGWHNMVHIIPYKIWYIYTCTGDTNNLPEYICTWHTANHIFMRLRYNSSYYWSRKLLWNSLTNVLIIKYNILVLHEEVRRFEQSRPAFIFGIYLLWNIQCCGKINKYLMN